MEAFLRVLLRRLLLGSRAVPLVLCEGCAEHQDVKEEATYAVEKSCNQSTGTQDSACSVEKWKSSSSRQRPQMLPTTRAGGEAQPQMQVGLPTQALATGELRRWVIQRGTKPWKHAASNPSRADIVGYTPSTAEQAWLTGEAQGRICNITKQPLVKAAVAAWMAYSASPGVWAPGGKPDPKPSPEQAAAMSSSST